MIWRRIAEKFIKNLKIGHGRNYIHGKLNGKLSNVHYNIGVLQGIPLITLLFLVYIDEVTYAYNKTIKQNNEMPQKLT